MTKPVTGHMPFKGHRTLAETPCPNPLPVHRAILAHAYRHPPLKAARVIHDALLREISG